MNPDTIRRLNTRTIKRPEVQKPAPGTKVEGRVLPIGTQYVGHDGKKARFRRLRQRYGRILKLAERDDATEKALLRCHASVEQEPDPDYAAMHLTAAADDAARGTGATWAAAMNSLLDRFAAAAAEAAKGGA